MPFKTVNWDNSVHKTAKQDRTAKRLALMFFLLLGFGFYSAVHTDVWAFKLAMHPQMPMQTSVKQPHNLHVLSYATNPQHFILQLLISSSPYRIEVLGLGQGWKGYRDKLEGVRAYLEKSGLKNSTKDIVMFVDGYDTAFTPGYQDLIKKFKSFKKPIVISAETNCVQHPICTKNVALYPKSPEDTIFKYVNSGTYMGYAASIYQMLDELLKKHPGTLDDQFALHTFFIAHPDRVALDYYQNIFSLLHGTGFEDYALDPRTKMLRNLITHTQPVVLHGNGGPELLLKLYRHYIGPGLSSWQHVYYYVNFTARMAALRAIEGCLRPIYNTWMIQSQRFDRFALFLYKVHHVDQELAKLRDDI